MKIFLLYPAVLDNLKIIAFRYDFNSSKRSCRNTSTLLFSYPASVPAEQKKQQYSDL